MKEKVPVVKPKPKSKPKLKPKPKPKLKPKRKQKREIKKIEDKKDLRITLAKRKCCIYKNASELTTVSGAKVNMLMRTSSGNWFSYGEPSHKAMEVVSGDGNGYGGDEEDHPKSEMDVLCEKNKTLLDQLYFEEVRGNELGIIQSKRSNTTTCGWWETDVEELSSEEAKELEASFVTLKHKLENQLLDENEKPSPMNDGVINSGPIADYTSGSSIAEVVFGPNINEARGIGASETILPDFSLSTPMNIEEEAFTFYPYGERREDLFDIVYPPTKQARVNNPNGSANFAFTHTNVFSSAK